MSINPTGGRQNNNPWDDDFDVEEGAQGEIGGRRVSYDSKSNYDSDSDFSVGSTESKTTSVARSNISKTNEEKKFESGRSQSSGAFRKFMHRIAGWFRGEPKTSRSSTENLSSDGVLKSGELVKGLKTIAKHSKDLKANSKKLKELWEGLEAESPVEYKLMSQKLLLQAMGEKQESIAKSARGISTQGKLLKQLKRNAREVLTEANYDGNDKGDWDKANIFYLFLLQVQNSSEGPAELMDDLNEIHDPQLTQIGVDLEKLKAKGPKEYSKGLMTLLKEGQTMLQLERERMMQTIPQIDYGLVGRSVGHSNFLLKEMEKVYSGVSDNALLVLVCDLFPPKE
ncbi:SemD/SinC family type III secretion system effector [Chlamydiifrater phoenicopteri]|uniref:SemD/SinC family type III secretion system effector n=1 Tax=Chlamydiifrater phoenicopteri TaxID=2681469 RepID=UPI001BCE8DE3|nr:hypothetical protein [Chlamydiifrater phoenicopteri]